MKKLAVIVFAVVVSLTAQAQETDSTELINPQRDIITDTEESDLRSDDDITIKDETDEQAKDKASQAERTIGAQLKDEKLESKTGPDGEPVFVNTEGQYYYINERGEKTIVDKSELKVKN